MFEKTVSFNLAKRVLVIASDEQKVALRLKELRKRFLNCGYLESVIEKSFLMQNYKLLQINQQILKILYLPYLHNIQILICERKLNQLTKN